MIRLVSSCPDRLRSLKTWLDIALGNLLRQPEQIIALPHLQRSHSTSATPWFCDLKHPSFYLHKPGLPFLVQIHVSHWISAQQLLTAPGNCAGGFAEAYLTGCPAAGSSNLLSRCSSIQHSVSCERVLYRWNAYFLCWSWGNVFVNIDKLSLCTWGTGVAIYNTKPVSNLYPASTFL